ncbi:hypothetical protein [Lunatimonas salinarum]|uniref:hypothetical protein n=1 Tax=Lunatimonas salinarum TaxID=1774590 RepID=UPI003158F33F
MKRYLPNPYVETHLLQKILRIILGSFMILAAIGHFTFQREEFQAQVPNWIPLSKDLVVILSGIIELSLGLAMVFWKKHRVWVGLALGIFFVLIFPGNVAQYVNGTDAFGLDTDRARLIRLFFQPVLILWALWSTGALKALSKRNATTQQLNETTFYDLEATDIRGVTVKMDQFKGNVVLVVNTATKCGLAPQFEGLEKLHQTYQKNGLVVLGFPSNQFANQEPGSDKNISETCSINYGVTFPLMRKVHVNGKNTHPVFAYLKQSLGGLFTDDIKWNFTKFLIDRDGNPVKRFAPTTKPEKIEATIKQLL